MFGPGWGFWHSLQAIFASLGGFLLVLILLAIAVLLVRYLLIATKAAELYLAQNKPTDPGTTTWAANPAAPTAPTTPVVPDVPPTPPTTTPAPRTRAPKTPPSA